MSTHEGHAIPGPLRDFPMPRWLYPQPARERMHHRLEDMKHGPRNNRKPYMKRKV